MEIRGKLSIVMPVYNGGKFIESTVLGWLKEMRSLDIPFELHVYNDGSTDNSLAILLNIRRDSKELVVHDKENTGHGPTLVSGYRENAGAEWIFQTDSDQELSASDFPKLWALRKDYDLLLGARHQRLQPPPRKILSFFSRLAVWTLYGRGARDVNSPYRLMRAEKFKPYYFMMPSDTFAPNVILTGTACSRGFRIYEVSIPHRPTSSEGSGFETNAGDLLKAATRSFRQLFSFRRRLP